MHEIFETTTQIYRCHNPACKKDFERKMFGRSPKYCSNRCKHADYYALNKQKIRARRHAYYERNIIRRKEWAKNYYLTIAKFKKKWTS